MYTINNINTLDTPALVIYKDRVSRNIDKAIAAIGNVSLLRPHVKTNKITEVCRMMIDKGITRFKCATIAEAEMLAIAGAEDILLSYQPVGPKAERFLQLSIKYTASVFSCTLDDLGAATHLSNIFHSAGKIARVYIDLDTGMNRTGVPGAQSFRFADKLLMLPALKVVGIHAYDGHITDSDITIRQQRSDEGFRLVEDLRRHMEKKSGAHISVVAGGSPTFLTHVHRNVECSPGTFVFWDYGYHSKYPDEPYEFAAVVLTRVISVSKENRITTDLGYKSIASENPLPRVYFINAPDAIPLSQSEEHLVLSVPPGSGFSVGDVLYGLPVHICPTVALYEQVGVVEEHVVNEFWQVSARSRMVTI